MPTYSAYADDIWEDALYYEEERTSDIQLPPTVNVLLFATWLVACLVGFAIVFVAKRPIIGATLIAIPTFIGMVIKPTFALCMMMLVLPTGAGLGLGQVFSLDRGIGFALAVSFFLNLLITRPGIRVGNKAIWVVLAYTVWICLASLAGRYRSMELQRAFTQIQLLVMVLIVYWILETNTEKTLHWALRAYVFGTLATMGLAVATGAAVRAVEETGEARYAATLGRAIDANMLAALASMAFLAAIFMFVRDRSRLWRVLYVAGILILPVMLLRMGSRGGLVALAFTVLSPLLFVRQVVRRPALAALLVLVIVLGSVSVGLLLRGGRLEASVAQRLTDIGYAKESIGVRMEPVRLATKAAFEQPIGTGFYSWFERTGSPMWPHSDFFLVLGVYGLPGAVLFVTFIVMMMLTIRRIPLGPEKLYARAVLIYLLVMGLNIGQVFKKYFWIFLAIALALERISWFYVETAQDDTEAVDEYSSSPDHLPYVPQSGPQTARHLPL